MKELFNIFKAIIRDEGFTTREVIVYGIAAPAALVLAILLACIIEHA